MAKGCDIILSQSASRMNSSAFAPTVKLNLAEFAVAVCLVKVGRGGDFLFPHCSGFECTLAEVP